MPTFIWIITGNLYLINRYHYVANCPNGMFRLVKGLKTDSKEVEGGRCIRGSNGIMELEWNGNNGSVTVRRKDIKSGRIIWKGS